MSDNEFTLERLLAAGEQKKTGSTVKAGMDTAEEWVAFGEKLLNLLDRSSTVQSGLTVVAGKYGVQLPKLGLQPASDVHAAVYEQFNKLSSDEMAEVASVSGQYLASKKQKALEEAQNAENKPVSG